jgi:hypothetical protein
VRYSLNRNWRVPLVFFSEIFGGVGLTSLHRSRSLTLGLFVATLLVMPLQVSATPCGDSLKILLHAHGVDSTTQVGWSIGPLGDINHDGFGDVAVAQYDPALTLLYLGGSPPNQVPVESLFGIYQGSIDIDGDGNNEIITSWVFEQSTAPRGAIYFFKGFSDSVGSRPYDSIYSPTYNAGYGTNVVVGNADGDFLGDLLVSQPNRLGGAALYLLRDWTITHDTVSDWSYEVAQYSHQIISFGFIDFNCDGHEDIFMGLGPNVDTVGYVYIFLGPNFKSSPDFVLSAPSVSGSHTSRNFAQSVSVVGDVNGDGFPDLGVIYDFQLLVYFSSPTVPTTFDRILQGRAHSCGPAGDVNGDGHDDLIAGQTRTGDGAVDVYLGGPNFDSVFDCSIYRADLPPVFLQDIGFEVASAGDFNGDGVGDLMFSCRNFAYGTPGDVFVIAGGRDILSGVDNQTDPGLPQSFALRAPYPNPFNPSTTISFDLPKRGSVKLVVYDVLGREVRRLVDQEMSAGTHSVTWDGTDQSGHPAASGVYFFRMTAGGVEKSVKGVLLK